MEGDYLFTFLGAFQGLQQTLAHGLEGVRKRIFDMCKVIQTCAELHKPRVIGWEMSCWVSILHLSLQELLVKQVVGTCKHMDYVHRANLVNIQSRELLLHAPDCGLDGIHKRFLICFLSELPGIPDDEFAHPI